MPRGHIPGWVAPSSETRAAATRGRKPTTVSGSGRSLEALASGAVGFTGNASSSGSNSASAASAPASKSAKKNAKRAEKKREDKQKALEAKIKDAWDEDSDEDASKPAAAATTSTDATSRDGGTKEDETGDLAQKVAKLSV
ncbi:hypothetical protein FRC16_003484 [Serendipita sp. 398]|nr:hypothetical protein FRC16_003484 [Serendipita sp. 398]